MQYKPNRNPKHVAIIGVVLIAIATVFLVMANFKLGFVWINELGAILTITILLYLLIRYAMTDFVYILPETGAHLTVKKLRGNLPQTVAEVDLTADCKVLPYSKEALRREKVAYVENYCVSLHPEETYVLIAVIDSRKIALRLECKKDVADIIAARIGSAPAWEESDR